MADFDAYLMVDWSANSKPKTGKDSIWYYMVTAASGESVAVNPSTREQAVAQIANLLAENLSRRLFTLVGFDFPYGYPSGLAAAFGFKQEQGPFWRQIWDLLSRLIKDDENNSNNRFQVAAHLNEQVSGTRYPFWGCPTSEECSTLSRQKTFGHAAASLPEKRITERLARGVQSSFKLYGPGTVGSQALLGIPRLAGLTCDARLARVSRVWPFQTGLQRLSARRDRDWRILHAEIYPGIIATKPRVGEVKDAVQVRGLAQYFAKLDQMGELSRLFEVQCGLDEKQRRSVENEEGWILGSGSKDSAPLGGRSR